MVCLGNICRSPLAEGILKSKLNPDLFFVDSAGTGGWHEGETPDPRSISTALKNGIDISAQRARKFRLSDFDEFDIIYAMDSSNEEDLKRLAATADDRDKIKRILSEIPGGKIKNVPDPYYGSQKDFDAVFSLLEEVCTEISNKLS